MIIELEKKKSVVTFKLILNAKIEINSEFAKKILE